MKLIALLLLTVAVAHASVTVTRTSNDARHPSTMEIEVTLPDSSKKVLFPLTRTDAFEDIPMTLMENGVSRTFSSRQLHRDSHSHYRDIQSTSVISVREVNGNRQLSGHVMHEGTSYFLEPVGDSKHRVTKNELNPEVMAKQIDNGSFDIPIRKRQTNTAATTYTVEIVLLLDDTVWSAMRNLFDNETKALTELHLYYTHILNGIDTAYRNIGSLSISIKCIGITIAKNASDSIWMPESLDGFQILLQLVSYARGKTADHFMAFTRKDFTYDGMSSACGLAFLRSACTDLRVSITEDLGLQSWGTAAHELGHNLGSPHDGSGNSCDPDTKNLMSTTLRIYSMRDVANSYRFSPCTIESITNYINGLDRKVSALKPSGLSFSGSSNCLTETEGNRVPQLSQNVSQGSRLTLDQVCRLSFPKFFFKLPKFKMNSSNPAEICASIECQIEGEIGGSTLPGLRAPVGTPCGNQKSCNWNGECTTDFAAPRANEACFWGDSWDASTCRVWKEVIKKDLKLCQGGVMQGCCESLADLCK